MRWSEIRNEDCSVARALSVVGERWTMLVLREAFNRTRRFEDFQRRTGAPRPVLAERLRALTEDGVLHRTRYARRPDRFEYRLTEKGLDLYPVVVSLMAWGDRWMAGEEGPPVRLTHRACETTVTPRLTCPACGEPVRARDMRVAH
ncbi:winged helix-turn-helix transcriptional regulator [Amycolatopsis aidingensis]|uniref:winged helix-turn-helix transcriptional regulator n=1 Tax=Amycolatopsis aidingensis TaxID=2842453 RepID=UPI001C0B6E94|nr:helix-turn-helix domain-containing protein [Amycolatopsis aidingensis]